MTEPTAESLRAELGDILAKGGDPSALDAKYKQLYGDKPVEVGIEGVKVGPAPTGEEAEQTFFQESLAECDRVCRAEWGEEYDANMTLIRETATQLLTEAFPEPGRAEQMLEKVAGAFFEAGGTMADMNRLLLKIAKRGA